MGAELPKIDILARRHLTDLPNMRIGVDNRFSNIAPTRLAVRGEVSWPIAQRKALFTSDF